MSRNGLEIETWPAELRLLVECCHPAPGDEQLARLTDVITAGIDWNALLRFANYHQVVSLVRYRLQKLTPGLIPAPVWEALGKLDQHSRMRAIGLMVELLRIVKACRAEGVELICLKGPVLALQLHGDISRRHCMDLDFLVRFQDVRKTHSILQQLGYEATNPEIFTSSIHWSVFTRSKHHVCFRRTGETLQLEVHFRLFKNPHVLSNQLLDAWSRSESLVFRGVELKTLASVDNMIFLCVHGSIHRWFLLKWLADVAHWCQACPADWESLAARATVLGLDRPVAQSLCLRRILFDAPVTDMFAPSHPDPAVLEMTRQALQVVRETRERGSHGLGDVFRERLYLLKLKRTWRYKLRYVRDLFYLDSHRNILRLPSLLFPLYLLLNPFLWFYKNYLRRQPPREK